MFVNYFIIMYLHNYIVRVLFAYYYTACIIVIIILSGDTHGALALLNFFGKERARGIRGNNQSLFYRVYPLNRRRIETSRFENGWILDACTRIDATVVPRRSATISYRKVIVISSARSIGSLGRILQSPRNGQKIVPAR